MIMSLLNTCTNLAHERREAAIASCALGPSETHQEGAFLLSGRVLSVRKSGRESQHGLQRQILTEKFKRVLLEEYIMMWSFLFQCLHRVRISKGHSPS